MMRGGRREKKIQFIVLRWKRNSVLLLSSLFSLYRAFILFHFILLILSLKPFQKMGRNGRLEWKKRLRKKEREGCIILFSSFGTLKKTKRGKEEKSHFDASIIYFKDGLFEHSLESSFNVQLLVLLKKQRQREETKGRRKRRERDGMEGKEKTEERTSCETKMNFVNRNNVMFPFRFSFFSSFLPVLSLILVCNPFIG